MSVIGERCAWARTAASIAYHDREWGVPEHDDRKLFELLVLEGAQAGLSWETILAKRENYRRAFANFVIETVAAFDEADRSRLLADAGIVRNRAKIASAIGNARAVLAVCETLGSFDAYLWGFTGGVPSVNAPATPAAIAATTPLATKISKDMRSRGFSFVGPTIVYAFMQATGMVDDHLASCPQSRAGRRGA